MRQFKIGVLLTAALAFGLPARAGIQFETESTASQTIDLFGTSFNLFSTGPQQFTIDPVTGYANVASEFAGNNLPDPLNPGGFLSYLLYNTVTTGNVTQNPSGSYDISFSLLFELKVTSGPFSGLTLETQQDATFASADIASLPFPPGTAFSDPTHSDTLPIYVKFDPTNTLPVGAMIGTSSDRVVTITSIVPEPTGLALVASGGAFLLVASLRRSRQVRAAGD